MRRALLVFCLAVSICFQGVALAKQVLSWDGSGDAAHSLLHAQSVSHHHHHDGSIHKDTSRKSKQHVQADGCVSLAFIPSSVLDAANELPTGDTPSSVLLRGHDSPFLEGLKRPPR